MQKKPRIVSSENGLKVSNLRKSLSRKQIVRDVSINLRRGQTVGLLGPNGAGKTTTFYMIMGLIKCDGGNINLDGQDLTTLPMHMRASLGMGFLPQQPSIFRGMTVENNLLSIIETKNYSKEQRQNILEELLTEFSLTHLRRAMPHMLSGGERRRTEIARCLCSNPSIILMDEPTAGVDPIGIDDIKLLIRQLMKKNIGVLITDHNVREVLDICDYSYVMHSGAIISEGDSKKIIGSKDVRKFYLGDSFKF